MIVCQFRSIRRIQNQQARTRLPSPPCPPAELPLPQTSTLRSRRRLANILVIAGFVFMACWSPHVICLIFREFSITSGCSNTVTEFVMLLGMLFSIFSSIYLRLNFSQVLHTLQSHQFSTGFSITIHCVNLHVNHSRSSILLSVFCAHI